MDSTHGYDMAPASGDGPIVRFRDLVTVGEDAAGRHLVGSDSDSGERVAIVVARPLADASLAVARAHADVRVAAAQRAAAEPVEGIAPVRAVGRTPGGHPFSVSALGTGSLAGALLAGEQGVPTDEAIHILLGAARALANAHAAGRVHGSIGPHSLIVAADGGVSLHGFGIAMPLDRQRAAGRAEIAAAARREDVRALARVGRALFADGRRTARRMGAGLPAAVGALIARAESADRTLTARELALGLEDAAHEQGAAPSASESDSIVIPAASAYDSSRWAGGRRPIARIAVAVAAALALLLLFGDFVRRASGDPEPVRTAQDAPPEAAEEQGAVYDSLAPEAAPSAPDVARPLAAPRGGGRQAEAESAPAPPAPPRENVAGPETNALAGDAVLGAIPAGATVRLLSGERVCTNTHDPGDRFPATVAAAVESADGAVLPAGASATVEVTSVDQSESAQDPASIGLRVRQITADGVAYPIASTITSASVEQVATSSRASDAGKVVGGAVAGAILGQVLGGDARSTVIGAATGAAAGTAIAMGTRDRAGCIPQGGAIALRLDRPMRIAVQ